MIDQNENLKALQELAYDGTPEEVCLNFKTHAYEALNKVLNGFTKNKQHNQVECDRAMHFFNEALDQDYKEY